MISGVAQVQVFGAQKYAVRVQLDPHALAARGSRHRRGRAARSRSANVNLPTGTLYGPHRVVHGAGHRPADERRRLPADDRRLPQRLAGAPRGARPRHRQRGERQGGELVQAASAASCSPSSGSPAPTPSRWSTASSALLPHVPQPSCRRRSTSRRPLRPLGHDPRVGRRRAVHPAADARRWWCW